MIVLWRLGPQASDGPHIPTLVVPHPSVIYDTLHTHTLGISPQMELNPDFPLLKLTISIRSHLNASFRCLRNDSEAERREFGLGSNMAAFCLWGDVNVACQREVEVCSRAGGGMLLDSSPRDRDVSGQ